MTTILAAAGLVMGLTILSLMIDWYVFKRTSKSKKKNSVYKFTVDGVWKLEGDYITHRDGSVSICSHCKWIPAKPSMIKPGDTIVD